MQTHNIFYITLFIFFGSLKLNPFYKTLLNMILSPLRKRSASQVGISVLNDDIT